MNTVQPETSHMLVRRIGIIMRLECKNCGKFDSFSVYDPQEDQMIVRTKFFDNHKFCKRYEMKDNSLNTRYESHMSEVTKFIDECQDKLNYIRMNKHQKPEQIGLYIQQIEELVDAATTLHMHAVRAAEVENIIGGK